MAKKPQPPASAPRLRLIIAGLLIAAIFAAYANSLPVPFLFDDQINITDNPYIRLTSLSPDQLLRAMVQDKNQLRPFSNLTFGLDFYFHGLNPKVMHLENIALHALSALLLFALLQRLWPARPDQRRLTIVAAIGAAAWALSPVHTQAVTYLVQRHTLMASAFTLLSVYCWVRGRTAARARMAWFAGAAVAFVIAAGSKESGFLAPLFWLFAEPLIPGSPAKRMKTRTAAVAVASVAAAGMLLLTALCFSGMLAGFAATYRENGYGPVARLATEARVVISYLATILLPLPSRLMLDHDVLVSTGPFSPWSTTPAGLIILAAIVTATYLLPRRPAISVCILGFLLALSPESSVIPVELMNDHRMYLAAAFVVAPLAAWAALHLPSRSLPLLLGALLLLGCLTALRNRDWQNPARLWADSAQKSPSLYRPWSNLCGALTASGDFRSALNACNAAQMRNPPGPMPLVNRGISLAGLGAREEAGKDFAEAARRWPESALARFNYGGYLFTTGRDTEAMAEVSRALELDQFLAPAYLLRARLAMRLGRPAQARADLSLVLRLYPDNEDARRLLQTMGGN